MGPQQVRQKWTSGCGQGRGRTTGMVRGVESMPTPVCQGGWPWPRPRASALASQDLRKCSLLPLSLSGWLYWNLIKCALRSHSDKSHLASRAEHRAQLGAEQATKPMAHCPHSLRLFGPQDMWPHLLLLLLQQLRHKARWQKGALLSGLLPEAQRWPRLP